MSKLQNDVRNASYATGVLWEIGESVFIRTVTYHLTGRIDHVIKENNQTWLVLGNAAWVADSGRFKQAIETGELNEVEPVNVSIRVNTSSITDVYSWFNTLPDKQK